jgi:hypothetical protein
VKTSSGVIVGLAVALVVSNALWAYHLMPLLTALNYGEREWEQRRLGIAQSLEMIKAFARSESSREQLIAAARRGWPEVSPQERNGYVWVGRLGLQFNDSGQLNDVVYWTPPE